MAKNDEERVRNLIREKGIEGIKKDPEGFFKEIGIEVTSEQIERIVKQLDLLSTTLEEQVMFFIYIVK